MRAKGSHFRSLLPGCLALALLVTGAGAFAQRLPEDLDPASGARLPYPTRAEYLRRLADQYNRTRLTPLVAKLMRAWLEVTG